MEVWALYAYGASHVLQEILTVKSDDMVGRVKTFEAIVKGENIPEPGIPESFRVLVKELQSLALDIRVLDHEGKPMELADTDDDLPGASEVNIEDDSTALMGEGDEGLGDVDAEEDIPDDFDIDSDLDSIDDEDIFKMP